MLRYRLPDGRSWKRLWEGWVGSFTMLLVLLEHRARKMSRMDWRGAPMIFAAVRALVGMCRWHGGLCLPTVVSGSIPGPI